MYIADIRFKIGRRKRKSKNHQKMSRITGMKQKAFNFILIAIKL